MYFDTIKDKEPKETDRQRCNKTDTEITKQILERLEFTDKEIIRQANDLLNVLGSIS